MEFWCVGAWRVRSRAVLTWRGKTPSQAVRLNNLTPKDLFDPTVHPVLLQNFVALYTSSPDFLLCCHSNYHSKTLGHNELCACGCVFWWGETSEPQSVKCVLLLTSYHSFSLNTSYLVNRPLSSAVWWRVKGHSIQRSDDTNLPVSNKVGCSWLLFSLTICVYVNPSRFLIFYFLSIHPRHKHYGDRLL